LNPEQLAFVEACLLSRAAVKAADMANIWRAIQQGKPNEAHLNETYNNVLGVWHSVLDRSRLPIAHNDHTKGEAWLRYWHFRVLSGSAESFPGLFKFSQNSIGMHQTTAPQHLIEAVRLMMNETAPGVPAGEARAVYLLAAINRIHAFVDGNGRLARFVFNRELQQAGLQTILFLPDMRKTVVGCLDAAQYRNDFEPFQQALLQATSETRTLLEEFKELLGTI
jgi:prophage maintenance system killer protein